MSELKREDDYLSGGEGDQDEEQTKVRAVFNSKTSKMLEDLRNLESPLKKLQLRFESMMQEYGRMWAAYRSHFGGVMEGDVDIEIEDIWQTVYQDIRGSRTVLNTKLNDFANRVALPKKTVNNMIVVVADELTGELSMENLLIFLDKLENEVGVVKCFVAERLDELKTEWEELQAEIWRVAVELEELKLQLQGAGYAFAQGE